MKTIIRILLFSTIFVIGCKKSEDSNATSSSTNNTDEYFSFIINSDSFKNEHITINGAEINHSFGFETFNGLQLGINDSSLVWTLARLNIEGIKTGAYTFNNKTSLYMDLQGRKGYPTIRSETGQINVTHFAKMSSDYFTGTFSGEFRLFLESTNFTITEGKFRIKRSN
jgi:hypothetical protein